MLEIIFYPVTFYFLSLEFFSSARPQTQSVNVKDKSTVIQECTDSDVYALMQKVTCTNHCTFAQVAEKYCHNYEQIISTGNFAHVLQEVNRSSNIEQSILAGNFGLFHQKVLGNSNAQQSISAGAYSVVKQTG